MSEEKDKPVLDEQNFAKLLEAAYVLQEHNRRMQDLELRPEREEQAEQTQRPVSAATNPPPQNPESGHPGQEDYTLTLAQIVDTQRKIQLRRLDLESAMSLVAGRVAEIARAAGAAVCIRDGKRVRYRAVAGVMTLPAGTEIPAEKALCAACLRTGQVMRCADIKPEFPIDCTECRRRGIQSLVAVPIYHEGEVAGSLELYYANPRAFTEQDVHTCQLMAGLVTESLARDEELHWKKSLATERAVMLEALEKLKPNLAALVDAPAAKEATGRTGVSATASGATFVCLKCGHKLVGEEQFCGKCGSPRSSDYEPPDLQSKLASLWHLQEEVKKDAATPTNGDLSHSESRGVSDRLPAQKTLADLMEEEQAELFGMSELPTEKNGAAAESSGIVFAQLGDASLPTRATPARFGHEDAQSQSQETAVIKAEHAKPEHAKPEPTADWSSAASARDFLQQIAAGKPGSLARFWNTRRGDIYLAIAVVLVAGVIRWGIWSNHSVSATGNSATAAGHRQPAPDADLSMFDRMLISLGLAEAPPPPEYKGNPETQVWVDLHTALYYCPGAELYGKTPKGKFTTQRDAQLDQFEPVSRKACD